MAKHGIHSLPVVDSADSLIGIITTTDIMYAALHLERREKGEDTSGSHPAHVSPNVSSTQMSHALLLANKVAGTDNEQGELARALLHAQSRLKLLESVLSCADRYVRAGQDERLHATLLKTIDRARDGSNEPAAPLPL